MRISSRLLPFAVLLCALLWGSAFPAIKAIYAEWDVQGIQTSFSNRLLLAGVRFMLGGVFLLCFAKQPWSELKVTPLRNLLGFSVAQVYFQYAVFYTALSVSSAVLGGLLISTGSLWWLVLAPLILKSPWPEKRQWALIGLGVIGVVVAVYRPGAGSGNAGLGALLFCLSTLSGAFAMIILQSVLKTMGARAATGWSLLFGGAMLALSGAAAWSEIGSVFPPKVIFLTGYLAIVSAVGFGIWNYLSSQFSVNLLAGYRFIIPVCAVIESSLFVKGETPGLGIFIGGSFVIASVIGLHRKAH